MFHTQQPRKLELPGNPPNNLKAAWSEMTYAQQSAFLSRLGHPSTRSDLLTHWMGKFGWRMTLAAMEKYRTSLTEVEATPTAEDTEEATGEPEATTADAA
jgi:hypothetical protein